MWVRYCACVRLFLLHDYTGMLIINETKGLLILFSVLFGILVWFPRCLQINVRGCLLTYCTYFTCAQGLLPFVYKNAKTQLNMSVLLFDFKTAGQLGSVSVRLCGLCFIIRVYRPKFWLGHLSLVVDATVLSVYSCFKNFLWHLSGSSFTWFEWGLISESTKQFTNQDKTKVALIFGKKNKLIYFSISENEEIELKRKHIFKISV